MDRQLKFSEAILEATDQAMGRDPSVYIVGLGVPDPKGIFGTTLGLMKKYGAARVQDMPLSENAMTGVALGSALVGMRPIITHQRVDFALVAMEQMVNQAAKWHYMFGGKAKVPMVVRMIIGRGWGQGPQHSQSLQAWFAHVPGLKVVMPTTAHDAKGLLAAAIEDNNPVIFIEHRWLHNISDTVPEEYYTVPLGKARTMCEGSDVTIVGTSYMALESLRAAKLLGEAGISAEVIDLRTIRPWDVETVLTSVRKTGRLVVADTAGVAFGVSAEIVATVLEHEFASVKAAPIRIGLPDHPCPTSPALANSYYPRAGRIVLEVRRMMGKEPITDALPLTSDQKLDIPDASFTGPF
ncbi:MAG: alpha-ketoacid dehydrogenase subunit beta [Proteobacteria bacterium]|nr:alpha-ketoacid dehydrogenase subunit beta [Pseudomonadota bacterium]